MNFLARLLTAASTREVLENLHELYSKISRSSISPRDTWRSPINCTAWLHEAASTREVLGNPHELNSKTSPSSINPRSTWKSQWTIQQDFTKQHQPERYLEIAMNCTAILHEEVLGNRQELYSKAPRSSIKPRGTWESPRIVQQDFTKQYQTERYLEIAMNCIARLHEPARYLEITRN